MNVLVTGATGKQGGATARGLLERGHVGWHTFAGWARQQDWSALDSP